jgi:thymidylate synthase (FAD)
LFAFVLASEEYCHRRYSVHFVCDRGVSHEFVRNRGSKGNSFAQESTRYCNYSKDKYNNEITFITPCWYSRELEGCTIDETDCIFFANTCAEDNFLLSLAKSEQTYFSLLEEGWKPQQARAVLPNALKTELVMTCFEEDWKHFFSLRADKAAHPQAQELAYPLKEEFEKRYSVYQS